MFWENGLWTRAVRGYETLAPCELGEQKNSTRCGVDLIIMSNGQANGDAANTGEIWPL